MAASTASPTPADRWAGNWYNNETITVRHNGTAYTGTIGNSTEPTPYHLYLKSGFSGGYVPQPGDTFTIAPLNDVSADQSPYAADIAAGRFYAVPGNHDATNMNDLVSGGSPTNPGAYCPHQNDGSGYYSGNQNCGYLFNRPTHYTAGFGSDGNGHDLADFFALDVRGSDPDGFGPGSRQFADYQNDLANSTAVWKIEAQHEPNWSSGEFGPHARTDTVYAGQNTNWTIDNRIDLFLAGHDHDMEQIYGGNADNSVSGKNFVVMGASGRSVDPFTKPPCPFQGISGVNDCSTVAGYPYTVWRGDNSATFGKNSHQAGALKLTITTTQLKAQYIAVDGTVLHSYSLYKSGAGEVRGTITDAATGDPVVGAKVSYADGDVYTGAPGSANGVGGYDFPDGIPPGTTLTVSAPGYQTATMTVSSVPDLSAGLAVQPQTGFFADSFESGDLSKWDSHSAVPPTVCGPVTAVPCTPDIGSDAADFKAVSPQAGGVQLTKAFGGTSATVDERAYFDVRSATTNATLFYFTTGAGGLMWHAYLDYLTGRIGIRADVGTPATYPGCSLALPTTYPWSGYHSVEAQTVVAPSGASTIRMWVDGQPETLPGPDGICNTADDAVAQTASVGNTNAGKVILGDTATNRTFDYWADDVAVSNSYIGSAWGSLRGQVTDAATGSGLAGATVTATYTANPGGPPPAVTDANGNYTLSNVIANQDLLLTVSASGYAPQTATVSLPFNGVVTYNAQLTAEPGVISGTVTDAASGLPLGNVIITGGEDESTPTTQDGHYTLSVPPGQVTLSAALPGYVTAVATVTVPNGGAGVTQDFALEPAPATLFSDNFETGTFASWNSNVNLTICSSSLSGCPHAGSYAARAAPSGTSAAYAARSLSAAAGEIYLRAYVYLRSQGASNATLLQVANGSGAPIAHVFINSAHQLGLRDDYALTTSQSTTALSAGSWHVLELHVKVNGTASATGVYLDGSPVPGLSSTSASLGTSKVAAVWIGDNQAGRTFDVLFDDVIAADGYIGP